MGHVIETVFGFFGAPAQYGYGMVAGIAITLVVVLGWVALRGIRRHRKGARGVMVHKEGGDVFVTVRAVREYVSALLGDYSEIRLTGVAVRQDRNGVGIKLILEVLPGTNVDQMTDGIRERVTRMATTLLGVHEAIRVDFFFDSSPTGQRRLTRAVRKAGGAQAVERSAESAEVDAPVAENREAARRPVIDTSEESA